MTLTDLDLDATLRPILASHATTIAAWRRNEPGAWGALAAQAILATRRALGRALTEDERRVVWERMWRLLNDPTPPWGDPSPPPHPLRRVPGGDPPPCEGEG